MSAIENYGYDNIVRMMTSEQKKMLINALLEAYPRIDDFRVMLALGAGKELDAITLAANSKARYLDVIVQAEAHGWLDYFLNGVIDDLGDPGNPAVTAAVGAIRGSQPAPEEVPVVRSFAQAIRLGSETTLKRALQRLLPDASRFSDPHRLRARLEEIDAAVGRFEVGGRAVGTAFLVDRDRVLTNKHVADLVDKPLKACVRFDYQCDANGVGVQAGVTHELAQQWLIAERPPSKFDEQVSAPQDPDAHELDYALVHLATPAADDELDNGKQRGFISLRDRNQGVPENEPLIIVQHPSGQPLKYAFGTALERNGSGNRQRYLVNTEGGSSGSPVFDLTLELVMLHHAGDPDFAPNHTPEFNQGIPIECVYRDLSDGGYLKGAGGR